MPLLSAVMTGAVATIHVYIVNLEMFLWTTPKGRKTFRMTPEFAESTKVLAANQGLYNGFLAVGLLWGLLHPNPDIGRQVRLFFLGCVAVAGAYGAKTVGKSILYVQFVPAVAGLAAVLAGL